MAWTSGAWSIARHTYGRNTVTYTGGGSGTISVSRTVTYTGGTVETVTVSGAGALNASVPAVLIDADVPFGVKVTSIIYRCAAVSITVPPEVRRWSVLSEPHTGLSVSVIGAQLGEVTYRSEGSVSWADGWADPLVDVRDEHTPSESLAFFTTTAAALNTVAGLAGSRRPLLLRSPDAGTDDVWLVLVGDRTVQRVTRRAGEQWRRHDWTINRLSRQRATDPQAGENLGAVDATYATLAALSAAHATLGSLTRAILTAEESAL